MLVVFSGMIYVALEQGGRFDHLSLVKLPQGASGNDFQMFQHANGLPHRRGADSQEIGWHG